MSHVIVVYSGIPYSQFLEERIFHPLNMSSTTFSPDKAKQSGKLADVWHASGRLIPFWITEDTIDLHAGPGGIISSVKDMVGVSTRGAARFTHVLWL